MKRACRNPKAVMGARKPPVLSVVPAASLLYEGLAMRYGAYEARRKDGKRGYGAYNWRKTQVIASTYVDAVMRHMMAWWDGEDVDADSGIPHVGLAKACLGIIADATENGNLHDDRPSRGAAPRLIRAWTRRA